MSADQPISSISRQSQTEAVDADSGTLMDDTVAIMDDVSALMGGPVTLSEDIRSEIKPEKPSSSIPSNR